MDLQQKTAVLAEVDRQVRSCRNCPLFKGTTKAVPGSGSPEAPLLLIGEAPGYWEDQQGEPFVGPAGKLLDVLLASIKLKRNDVFIANLIKHRPPANRDPLPAEIEACSIYLDRQIAVITPQVIVTLGRYSMNKFLPGEYISHTHGQPRFAQFQNRKITVVPMYHPAAALRSGKIMTELKTDFLRLGDFLAAKPSDSHPEPSGPAQLPLV